MFAIIFLLKYKKRDIRKLMIENEKLEANVTLI